MDNADSLSVRWWSYVLPTDGCWHWTGNTNQKGYGRVRVGQRLIAAHRVGYQLLVGPIPDGLEIDHLCKNRSCVNPSHLEPVSHRENVLRGDGVASSFASRTHCSCGKPFAGENLWFDRGRRGCVECRKRRGRERQRAYRARLSAKKEV